MKSLFDIILKPHVTEKSYRLNQLSNCYVFAVRNDANKFEIKSAIEKVFSVQVKSVNVLNTIAKIKTFRGRPGKRASFKKAYVTLKSGFTLDFTNLG